MDLKTYLDSNAGAAAKLAVAVQASPSLVHQWKAGLRPVPIGKCAAIESATDGQVTRKELRPNDWKSIWPELQYDKEKNHAVSVA